MVWGAIYKGGKSQLVILIKEDDETTSVNAKKYIRALEEGLLPIYKDWSFFQQDNARIHTAREVVTWFQCNAIEIIDWPAHSPDLNPIEHM